MEFYRIKKEEDNNYSYDGKILSGDIVTLPDPTHDLPFKYLFVQQSTEEISGIDRSASLLNTLIFHNEIESIQLLTDFYKNKNLEILNLLRTDFAFKIKLNNKNDFYLVNLINIEMQLGYPDNFLQRLVEYGISLKERNTGNNEENYKTLLLRFINNNNEDINLKSNSYFLSEFDSQNNEFIQKVDDFVDIVIINLFEISKKLENNEKIYILGKEIGNIGKNWLKLLSLRHWAKKLGNNTFEIPNICTDKEINSAIEYLKSVKNNELRLYYQMENDWYNKLKKATKEEINNMKKEAENKIEQEKSKAKMEIENAKQEVTKIKMEAEDKIEQEKSKAKIEIENVKQQMEKEKKERENDELKKFLDSYKKFNYSLEVYENTSNIDFSEMDKKMK